MEYTIVEAVHKKDMPPKEGFKPSQIIALKLSDGTTTSMRPSGSRRRTRIRRRWPARARASRSSRRSTG
jgi:hypothetical protein